MIGFSNNLMWLMFFFMVTSQNLYSCNNPLDLRILHNLILFASYISPCMNSNKLFKLGMKSLMVHYFLWDLLVHNLIIPYLSRKIIIHSCLCWWHTCHWSFSISLQASYWTVKCSLSNQGSWFLTLLSWHWSETVFKMVFSSIRLNTFWIYCTRLKWMVQTLCYST